VWKLLSPSPPSPSLAPRARQVLCGFSRPNPYALASNASGRGSVSCRQSHPLFCPNMPVRGLGFSGPYRVPCPCTPICAPHPTAPRPSPSPLRLRPRPLAVYVNVPGPCVRATVPIRPAVTPLASTRCVNAPGLRCGKGLVALFVSVLNFYSPLGCDSGTFGQVLAVRCQAGKFLK
jgi:hypothetical protein